MQDPLREPAGGASRGGLDRRLAPERGAPKRKRFSPVGCHGFASVIRAGACWSSLSARPMGCEAGWYRGKKLSSREQLLCSRDVLLLFPN